MIASAAWPPMSFSQVPAVWSHSGSVKLPPADGDMTLRFAVDATAPNPQRDGAIMASWDSPALWASEITPPDRMTWIMVSRTRNGMAFSDVVTRADTISPRHMEARASTAMPSRISNSGKPLKNEPWRHRPAEEPEQHQDDRLHHGDDPEDQQLGRQVRAGGQAGRAFPDIDRAFLDQLTDRARGAGQAGADDQQEQG